MSILNYLKRLSAILMAMLIALSPMGRYADLSAMAEESAVVAGDPGEASENETPTTDLMEAQEAVASPNPMFEVNEQQEDEADPTPTETAVPSAMPESVETETPMPAEAETPVPAEAETSVPVETETPVPTAEETIEPVVEDSAVPTVGATETPVPTDELADKTAIERAIDTDGFAYVLTKEENIEVFRMPSMSRSSLLGHIQRQNSLLYAAEYEIVSDEDTAIVVYFDTEAGVVTGYVSEAALKSAPLTMEDAQQVWKDTEINTWMDSQHRHALPLTAYIPLEQEVKADATVLPEETAQPVEDEIEPDSEEETSIPVEQARIIVDTANLRGEPDTDSECVGQVYMGDVVRILSSTESNDEHWYLVEYEGTSAYVRSDLLEIIGEAENSGEKQEEQSCTCGASDENGEYVHGAECPLYDASFCGCYDSDGLQLCNDDCECDCHDTDEKIYELTDEISGVRVQLTRNNLPEGIEADQVGLRVSTIDSETLAEYLNALGAETDAAVAAWDICLFDLRDGSKFQPVGSVLIQMPVALPAHGDAAVYRMDDATELEADFEQGECSFETEHFTPFLVLGTGADETPKNLTVRINWEGDEEHTDFRRTWINTYIKRDGACVGGSYSMGREKDWTLETTLPLTDGEGKAYEYAADYITSSIWPVYTATASSFENGVLTITLTYQSTADVDAVLRWSDDDDVNGLRPETITPEQVSIYCSGGDWKMHPDTLVKNEDGTWSAHFKDVPSAYKDAQGQLKPVVSVTGSGNYTISLDGVAPYYSTGLGWTYERDESGLFNYNVYSLTSTLQAVRVNASYMLRSYLRGASYSDYNSSIGWKHTQELGIDVPETVSMTLLSDGKLVERADGTVTYRRGEDGAFPKMEKQWLLPLYDADGNKIEYGEFSVAYSPDLEKNEIGGEYIQTVTTSSDHKRWTIETVIPGIGAVKMPATWDDDNNALNIRPTTLSATLLADGEPVGEAETLKLESDGNVKSYGYPDAWQKLPQRANDGHFIRYSIQLNDLPAYYEKTVTESPVFTEEKGYAKPTISYESHIYTVNENTTFALKTQTAQATVYWEGDGIGTENELKNRPAAVNLKLEYSADGGKTWQRFWGLDTFAVTAGKNPGAWTYEWSGLPAVDAAGNPIQFRVAPADTSSMYVTSVDEAKYTRDESGNVTHSEFAVHQAYNDNWNYAIDIKWDEANPAEKYSIDRVTLTKDELKARYQLTISTQKNYKPGDLEVRIPYELFDRRSGEGTGTVASRFSLGSESSPSNNYSFTYRIDNKGTPDTSDDEVVFYNYRELNASDNCIITVEYTIQPANVIDCSVGSLTANATGKYHGQTETEHQQSGPITYRVDTGVEITSQNKTLVKPVYYWDTSYGPQPDDFDMTKYNYVEYELYVSWRWNQPYTLSFVEKPGDGGELYRVRSRYGYSSLPFTADEEKGEYTWSITGSGAGSNYTYYYVIVRYPRIAHDDPMNPGQTTYETDYKNDVEYRLIASDVHEGDKEENDKNDVAIAQKSTSMHWVDYEFHYTGELVAGRKNMFSFSSGALTAMKYGVDQPAGCSMDMTVNGYNLTNGYSAELIDDAVYLCATINGTSTDYVRLTEADYEFSGKPYLSVTLTGVDRTNGQNVPGKVPTDPFILWGRKGGAGDWEEIGRLTMTSSIQGITLDEIGGKGYTALRVTSPNDLEDKAYIYLSNFNVKLLSNSPAVAQWLNADGLTQMTAQNVAAFNVYAKDDKGDMVWANPYEASTNDFSKKVGLDAEDKERLGAYQYRRNDYSYLYPVNEGSAMSKYVDRPLEDDVTGEILTAHFTVYEYESLNNMTLPQEIYDAKCQNGAVIYDLLPMGFVYAADRETNVFGASYSPNGYGDGKGGTYYKLSQDACKAALVSVKTIDDYRGTGRQMVIFTLKSLEKESENAYKYGSMWYTGFSVQFYARAGYDDLVNGVELYNIAAAQRYDLKAIGAGYTERGYGGYSSQSIFPLDENGQRVLYDVNNDGFVNEDKNTLYSYTEFTPSVIQTIQNGLAKTVKGKSGLYQKDDIVNVSGRYSYKLRLTVQKNGETSNVVLYDILENAANTGGASGEPNGWKGTFVGVNTRAARQMGIKPVVLYSTQANLSYNDQDSLLIEKNPGVWSETPPDDLTKVTAVAFDLRKAADGSDFVFPENSSVDVEIILTAPDSVQASEYAYNRPAYNCTFKPLAAHEGSESFNISDRTTLKLRDLQTISFIKEYENVAGERAPLAGVQFKLFRCTKSGEEHQHSMPNTYGACWGDAVGTANSTIDGTVRFDDLDTGVYAVYETVVPDAIDRLNNNYWIFEVDATKGTVSDPVSMSSSDAQPLVDMKKNDDGAWTLLNRRKTLSLNIQKNWSDGGIKDLRPEKLTFDLYRNGELYLTKEVDAKNGGYLGVVFPNLSLYDDFGKHYEYKVVERVPEGYTSSGAQTAGKYSSTASQTLYFTNTRLGVLDVKKVVKGSTTTAAFGFTVTLTDSAGKAFELADGETIAARRFTTDSSVYTEEALTPDANGNVKFTLSGGETLRMIGLPLGTKWKAAEESGNYTTTVTPTSASGSLAYNVNSTVTFTNTAKPTELALNVRKAVTGNVPAGQDKVFTFNLAVVTQNAPRPASTTARVTGSGTAAFGTIRFTAAGEYVYTVTEQAGSAKGYTYDSTVYTATAHVTDDNGQLKAVWSFKKGTEAADEALFTNIYAPTPAKVTIPVKKNLTGNATPSAKTFSFKLTATDGAPMPASDTVTITGTNAVNFGEITYNAAGTYAYTLKEVKGNDPGYTYDASEKTITVTVTDDNGTLKATWTADGLKVNNVEFTNSYKPAEVKIAIPVKKNLTGDATPADKTFSFKLTATGNAPMPVSDTVTITGANAVNFGEITYSAAGTYYYTLEEIRGSEPGYTYDTTRKTITVTVTDDNGTLKAAWAANGLAVDKVEFTNKYKPAPVRLSIPVKKNLTGSATPSDKTFSFKLTAKDGAPMPLGNIVTVMGAHETSFGEITYNAAGIYTYTLQEIKGNDAGYTYDASEKAIKVTVTDDNGTLKATWTADDETVDNVEFTNGYKPAEVKLALPVSKSIRGNATPEDKVFTFKLTAKDGAPMPNGDTVTITSAGKKDFGEITYSAAGEYAYTLKEIEGTDKGYTYDSAEREITVTVTDVGGALKAEWKVNGEKVKSIEFINEYKPETVSVELPVSKRITGNATPEDKMFAFRLTAKDNAPMPAQGGETVTVTGEGKATFGKISYEAAGEYAYTVEEIAGNDHGYGYDAAKRTVLVTVTDENGTLKAAWTVDGEAAQSIEFVNTYTPAPAKVVIPVKKNLTGNVTPADKTFSFALTAVTAGAPMPDNAIVTITGADAASFGEITYSAAGTYTYTLKEIKGSDPGYTYDASEKTIKVTVTDDNGTLKATWTADDATVDKVEFTNGYKPAEVKVTIPVKKNLTGDATPSEKTFSFKLTAKDGAPMPENDIVTITGANEASFGEITYSAAGTYTYTLKEIKGNDPGYTYDASEKTIKVTVTDDNGALKATWTADDATVDKVEFTNGYKPAEVKLALPVSKTIQYVKPETNKTFTFQLTAVDSAPMPSRAITTITGEGSGSFDEITYTEAGEWHYKVQEIAGTDAGYTYDATIFDVSVIVTDVDGVLKAAWTVDGEALDELAFTNHYLPNPVELKLPVRKNLSGNARPAEPTFTFEIAAATENAPMPESNAVSITGEGGAEFGAIRYTEIGTWQYTVTERNGGAMGYVYDDITYTVTVTVTDNDGNLEVRWTTDQGDVDALAFENAYHPASVVVELPVKKNISGNATPTDKEFTFQLTAKNDAPMPDSDTVTITGVGTVSFGKITYSAAGTYTYTLKEIAGADTGYTYDTGVREITVNVTDEGGVLKAEWMVNGETAESVEFANNYKPASVSIELPVSKKITGNATPEDKVFTFHLTAKDNAPMPAQGGETVTVTGEGKATFGKISYEAAGEYAYTVEEIAGNDHGYGYDSAVHTVLVTVTDEDGTLKAEWTLDGEKAESVEFVNVYAPDSAMLSIPVEKRLTGAVTPEDKTFEFELTALDGAPLPENGEIRVTITGAGASTFGVMRYDRAGEYHYQVREIAGSEAGYLYDATVYDVTVTVKDENGVLKASWSIPNTAQEIVFTNDYLPAPVELDLPVRKTVEGPVPEGGEKTFEFALEAVTPDTPMPEQTTLTITGSGMAEFEKLHYAVAGVYEYTLAETDGGAAGYTYDTAVRKITVTVTDVGGALKAEWTVDAQEADEILFTNHYAPEKTQIVLGAQKVLKGKNLKADMFAFLLSDEAGNVLQETRNAEDGSVTFEPIEYDAVGEYVYVISEKKESLANVTYDAQTYTVRVTVTDEDGVLKAETDILPETIVFTNQYRTEIPKTGYGAGGDPTYLFGVALMMLLAGMALRKKKRA